MEKLYLDKLALFIVSIGLIMSTAKASLEFTFGKEAKISTKATDKSLDAHQDDHNHIRVKKLKCKHGVCKYV